MIKPAVHPCFAGNALWCEAEYGARDYRPIDLMPGEALLFDGGYLEHGSVANDTEIGQLLDTPPGSSKVQSPRQATLASQARTAIRPCARS